MSTADHTATPDLSSIVAQLDERGYALIPSAIAPEEADAARRILEKHLEAEYSEEVAKTRAQRVGRIAVKDPVFRELLCHPLIVALWRQYLGPDMICSTWTANTLYPGHDRIGWHADYPYWALEEPWPQGTFTAQTIWLLDDFTPENGATAVVPGSHRKLCRPSDPTAACEDAEILTGVRGSVIVAHGALWHTARPNTTDRPRSCLLGMYIRPHCVTMEDLRGQLARIEDPPELLQQLMGARQRQPRDIHDY